MKSAFRTDIELFLIRYLYIVHPWTISLYKGSLLILLIKIFACRQSKHLLYEYMYKDIRIK